eukprot:COSAG01_NODE_4995_length_4559_cov_6.424439_4_plen_78_part_00
MREFEQPNVPVIITGVVEQWPAYKRWGRAELSAAVRALLRPFPLVLVYHFWWLVCRASIPSDVMMPLSASANRSLRD